MTTFRLRVFYAIQRVLEAVTSQTAADALLAAGIGFVITLVLGTIYLWRLP